MLNQKFFVSDEFSDVGLMEANDAHRIGVSAIGRRPRRDPEPQRQIVHGVNHDALVLVRALRDPAQSGFQHVVSVEILLLRRRLQPDLVLGERGQIVQGRDVQPELPRFRELAETRAKGDEVGSGHVGRLLHDLLIDVEHPVSVESKAVAAAAPIIVVAAVQQLFDVLADVFGQLLEEQFRLFFG